MERRFKEEGPGDSELSIVDTIKKIAAHNARADLNDEKQLELFLKSWWSKTYNRPLKDPLLLSYTLEELLYEFFDREERESAYKEALEKRDDKIEEDKEQAALDWAEEEEKKELEKLKDPEDKKKQSDPTKDPENIKWMEEELKKAKELYGESFGDDISDNFSE